MSYFLPRASVRSLPVELVDIITNYLRDDRDALLSCSYVTRLLLVSCRRHLFSSFKVRAVWDRRDDHNGLVSRFVRFGRFLMSSTGAHTHIRRLKLVGHPWPDCPSLNPPLLAAIVNMLPNLKELHMLETDFERAREPIHHSVYLWPPVPRPIQKLVLNEISIPVDTDSSTLLDILSIFSDIEQLRTTVVKERYVHIPFNLTNYHYPPALNATSLLSIGNDTQNTNILLEMARRLPMSLTLRRLYVHVDAAILHSGTLQALLNEVGPRLEVLMCDLDMYSRSPLDISKCTHLRSLDLRIPIYTKRLTFSLTSFENAFATLRTFGAPSPTDENHPYHDQHHHQEQTHTLKAINIFFDPYKSHPTTLVRILKRFNWRKFDKYVTMTSCFQALHQFTVTFEHEEISDEEWSVQNSGPGADVNQREFVTYALPELNMKGLLQVAFDPYPVWG